MPGLIGDGSPAELVSVTVKTDDDDGFSGKHLEVVSTFRYPQAQAGRSNTWSGHFPTRRASARSCGSGPCPASIAKELRAAMTGPTKATAALCWPRGRGSTICRWISPVPNCRRYWGYYNDPGNRHDQSKDMLEEKVVRGFPIFQPEAIDWASGEAVEYGDQGVVVVKESPKCVNQQAHLTGGFFSGPQGLAVTGWGLAPDEIVPDRFRECWATWTHRLQRRQRRHADGPETIRPAPAIRCFPSATCSSWPTPGDRPTRAGASSPPRTSCSRRFPPLADLGVDVLQIDDGWQKAGGGPGASSFLPKYAQRLERHQGRRAIGTDCDWGCGSPSAMRMLADLKKNLDELGFITWKSTTTIWPAAATTKPRIAKYRAVMKYSPQDPVHALPRVRRSALRLVLCQGIRQHLLSEHPGRLSRRT